MAQQVCSSTELRFVCRLAGGLHARPASHLAERAAEFIAACTLTNLRTGATANARSVLALIAADVRHGDEFTVRLEGAGAESACAALRHFLEHDLPAYDEPLVTQPPAAAGQLPRTLPAAEVRAVFGEPASAGVGAGKVVVLDALALRPVLPQGKAEAPAYEQQRAERAVAAVRVRLEQMLAQAASSVAGEVLRAHLAILQDVSLHERVAEFIAGGRSAAQAIAAACDSFAGALQRSPSLLVRERALDVQDIGRRLLEEICGAALLPAAVRLTEPAVLVAEALTPQSFLALDRQWLKGLVLESAGTTSHTLILARSFGIPAVTGVRDARLMFTAGQEVVIDGSRGFVAPSSSPAVQRFCARESATLARRQQALARFAKLPARTADGRPLEIAANVAQAEELEAAFAAGADGIGVFRTEMLFAGRPDLPSEDEQAAVYTRAVQAAAGRPVLIRALDVGGDKPLASLALPREPNPFLGRRGVRLYPLHQDIIRVQLRAMLRASAAGPVRIMLPMISSLDEVRSARALLARAQAELRAEGVAFAPEVPLGIMVEVPSAAFMLEELAREADFFSLGTNDLAQYFFAADRDNPSVAALASPRHPAFLRFLRQIVDGIRAQGKWVGLCGDMAADLLHLPLLLGLGLDEISVPPALIAALKERVSRLSAAGCEHLLARALACTNPAEVTHLLEAELPLAGEPPLIADDLIVPASDSQSPEEAISELVDLLFVAGRTRDRARLEEAIWAREAAYSTALGHGFAIPHCKSEAATADSIALLRLPRPMPWGTAQEKVQLVILLALREPAAGNRHLQVFSRLARKLMDEAFRAQLLHAPDSTALSGILEEAVSSAPSGD